MFFSFSLSLLRHQFFCARNVVIFVHNRHKNICVFESNADKRDYYDSIGKIITNMDRQQFVFSHFFFLFVLRSLLLFIQGRERDKCERKREIVKITISRCVMKWLRPLFCAVLTLTHRGMHRNSNDQSNNQCLGILILIVSRRICSFQCKIMQIKQLDKHFFFSAFGFKEFFVWLDFMPPFLKFIMGGFQFGLICLISKT